MKKFEARTVQGRPRRLGRQCVVLPVFRRLPLLVGPRLGRSLTCSHLPLLGLRRSLNPQEKPPSRPTRQSCRRSYWTKGCVGHFKRGKEFLSFWTPFCEGFFLRKVVGVFYFWVKLWGFAKKSSF